MSSLGPLLGLTSVTLDASFVIGLCAKEPGKYAKAQTALQQRIATHCILYAPHLLVMEVSYVLCGKMQSGTLTPGDYQTALANFQSLLTIIHFPLLGDAALMRRAEQIRQGHGYSRSADSFYIALAEHQAASGPSELLTDVTQAGGRAMNYPSGGRSANRPADGKKCHARLLSLPPTERLASAPSRPAIHGGAFGLRNISYSLSMRGSRARPRRWPPL